MTEEVYKVYKLRDGTVIDHIPHWKGMQIIELLGLQSESRFVTLGIGLSSKRHKRKDIVKIEHRELTEEEVQRIALIAPTATLNIIRGHTVVKKIRLAVPEVIEGIVKCGNPKCITNDEAVRTKFFRVNGKPLTLRCYFCERAFTEDEITLA